MKNKENSEILMELENLAIRKEKEAIFEEKLKEMIEERKAKCNDSDGDISLIKIWINHRVEKSRKPWKKIFFSQNSENEKMIKDSISKYSEEKLDDLYELKLEIHKLKDSKNIEEKLQLINLVEEVKELKLKLEIKEKEIISHKLADSPLDEKIKEKKEKLTELRIELLSWSAKKRKIVFSNFLQTKKSFLVGNRKETIEKLKCCCNELENSLAFGKDDKENIFSIIKAVGETVSGQTFGLVKLAGEIGVRIAEASSRKFLREKIDEFNRILINDEKQSECFKKRYSAELDSNQEQSFDDKYNIFNVINNTIWKNKTCLTIEEMKEIIKFLSSNLRELELELEKQFETLTLQYEIEKS